MTHVYDGVLTDARGWAANYTDVMHLYRDEGVVLRTIKLGEADRIVTIFTQGHGKVRAVAKGIRKTTSKFGARLEPTSRVAFQCYQGRELDIVTQAETLEANRALREEYALLTHAVPMLEAVDQVAQEREPNPALYRMLTGALRTLADHAATRSSRPRSSGSCSRSRASTRCSTTAPAAASRRPTRAASTSWSRSISTRAARCAARARAAVAGRSRRTALALLRRMLGGGLNGVLAETPGPAAHEVEHLGIRALEHHVERRLRSTALL